MDLQNQIIVLCVLIIFSGIFSAIETAIISVSMFKVKALVKQKRTGSKALHWIKQNPRQSMIAILTGNSLVNIGAASFATIMFTALYGSKGIGISTGVVTFLILTFGQIIPKSIGAQKAESISLLSAKPIEIFSFILYPLVKFFELISALFLKLFGVKKEEKLSKEELITMVVAGKKEGILSKEVSELVSNVLKFQKTRVTEIMIPKVKIQMIDGKKTVRRVISTFIKAPYSRYPVYFENKNNIIGYLDVDDILKHKNSNKIIKKIVRPIYFVPEAKEIDKLLSEFQSKDAPLAIVVNEYREITGMVTVEDVLKAIVGDIFDRKKIKKKSTYIRRVNKTSIKVDARATIEEINRVIDLGIKEEEHFKTIAGFIEEKLKRIPKKREKIRLRKVIVTATEVDQQGIKSVRITRS